MQADQWNIIAESIKKRNEAGGVSPRDIQDAQSLLSPEQKEKLDATLKDPDALQALLSSPAAKALLKTLGETK